MGKGPRCVGAVVAVANVRTHSSVGGWELARPRRAWHSDAVGRACQRLLQGRHGSTAAATARRPRVNGFRNMLGDDLPAPPPHSLLGPPPVRPPQ